MPRVTQGGSITLTAGPETAQGDAQDSSDLELTIVDADDQVLDGFPVTEPTIEHTGFGQYGYVFTCPIDLPVQTIKAIWSGTGDTDSGTVYGEDLIVVLEHGTIVTDPNALLTPAQLRAALPGQTSLTDDSLQMLLDATAAAIALRWGPVAGPLTERTTGGARVIFLRRPAASITSVSELYAGTGRALVATDWRLRSSGMSLLRLPVRSDWGDVEVVYVPTDDTAERKRIQLALMKLELAYSGLASQTDGSHSESQDTAGYSGEREAILNSYALPRVP